jgi:hypothetical protein
MWGKLKTKKRPKTSHLAEGTIVYSADRKPLSRLWKNNKQNDNQAAVPSQSFNTLSRSNIFTRAGNKRTLLLLAVAVLLAGSTAYVFRNSILNLSIFKKSCGDDTALIKQYNTTVRKEGVTKLQPVVEKIRQKNLSGDPTCLYMLLMAQYGDPASNEELETYGKLKQLESRGKEVSDKIDDGIDRAAVERVLEQQIEEKDKGYYGQG